VLQPGRGGWPGNSLGPLPLSGLHGLPLPRRKGRGSPGEFPEPVDIGEGGDQAERSPRRRSEAGSGVSRHQWMGPSGWPTSTKYCGQSFPGLSRAPAGMRPWVAPAHEGSSACGYRHRPARRAHRLPPRRRPGRARTAGVRRPVRFRPAAPMSPPDPDSGGWRPADQSDAFGDWFATASVPSRRGRPRVRRPRRDRFGWLLSPWLLAPTAAVAVATTGVALWLWQTAPTGTVQARPGAAVTITVPAATGGLPGGPGRPLRVIPPLPPRITPAQATASQSQAAGTGDEAGGTPAPVGTPRAEPGPVTPGGPANAPEASPSPTPPAAVPPATTAPEPGESATNAPPPAEHSTPPPEPVTSTPPPPVTTPPPPVTTPPPPVTTPPPPVTSPPPPSVATPSPPPVSAPAGPPH
jgi:hypothetical protein